jgi:outer membrane protein assembly factor BamE (lipoprotein component of BamABCDE complex)
MRRTIVSIAACTVLLFTSGCLVTTGSLIDERGIRVSSETLDQIEVGTTTAAWLVATLGEPSKTTVVEGSEHVRVMRYDHTVRKSKGGTVFLLFASGSDSTQITRTFFEITDGVVTRYWTEA